MRVSVYWSGHSFPHLLRLPVLENVDVFDLTGNLEGVVQVVLGGIFGQVVKQQTLQLHAHFTHTHTLTRGWWMNERELTPSGLGAFGLPLFAWATRSCIHTHTVALP